MKLQLASDLHLEFLNQPGPRVTTLNDDLPERLIGPVPGADVLVLAGDIANGDYACKLFADWPASKPTPILYVCGNHELYGHPIDPMYELLRKSAKLNNIIFLENDSVVIDGVRFLGTTLWTDYKLRDDLTQDEYMHYVQSRLNDHYLIRTGRKAFTTKDALERHEIALNWLQCELKKPFVGKTVVVTHHGPHPLSVHPRYAKDDLSCAFVSDLSDLMPDVDLWLHGHVHDGFDYQVGRCRVVANPAGYVLNRDSVSNETVSEFSEFSEVGYVLNRHSVWEPEDFQFENPLFDKNLLVVI